jgi:D-alanine-D-alanine ligase
MSTANRKMKVAVLLGGESSERAISLKTGQAFIDSLERMGIEYEAIDLRRAALPRLVESDADCALIAMHGRMGEGGPLQGVLEFLEMPYTGSGLLGSAVAMDKVVSKELFRANGVSTPDWWTVSSAADLADVENRFPLVVKPSEEGSSVGVSKVASREELEKAATALLASGQQVLIERCIDGRELSVALMDGEMLGVVEIEAASGFYDYESKYESGDTQYHIPPRISAEVLKAAEDVALRAWRALRCRGVGRIDVLLDEAGEPYVLEANTVPGMTPTSLVPKLAQASGYDFDAFVSKMLEGVRLDGGTDE